MPSCEQELGFKGIKCQAKEVSHWTDVQNCCSCKNSDSSNGSAAMACRRPHAFSWEGAWSFIKIGFFNLQADLWAFHGSWSALNLQSQESTVVSYPSLCICPAPHCAGCSCQAIVWGLHLSARKHHINILSPILLVWGVLHDFYVELAEKLGQIGRTVFHRQFESS